MKQNDNFFDNDFFEDLEKLKNKPRQRANYFEAHEKKPKELMVVDDLLQTINIWGIRKLNSPEHDPPDVVGTTESGIKIAFEVTELVNQKANELEARKNIQLRNDHHDFDLEQQLLNEELQWNVCNILNLLENRISKKEKKLAKIRDKFEKIILVVFSDENRIYHEKTINALLSFKWKLQDNIDEIWLIRAPISYNVRNNVFKLL